MDLEFESEDDADAELNRPLVPNSVLFDAENDRRREEQRQREFANMPRAAQAARDRDTEDVWAELG